MIYLSGCVRHPSAVDLPPFVGWMIEGFKPRSLHGRAWAADNGCFKNPDAYRVDKYLAWLDTFLDDDRSRCLFAVAPDRVGDPLATLRASLPVLPRIRDAGWPVAYVGQDGAQADTIPWDAFDCWFVGGSTEWKLSEASWALVAEAKARDKWVHVGRVNSLRRLRTCAMHGVNSVDGTYIAFGPDINTARLLGWFDTMERQPPLPIFTRP